MTDRGAPPPPRRNFVLKHHVFLVRNWEKIRQKQEEVKHTGDSIHSASLYTRWNGICRDDGNIKSGRPGGLPGGLGTAADSLPTDSF